MFQHWPYLLILAAIALIVFGPARLPELGASLGRAIKEFRKATTEMSDALKEEVKKPEEDAPTSVGTTYLAAPEAAVPTPPVDPATPVAAAPTATPAVPTPPSEAPKA